MENFAKNDDMTPKKKWRIKEKEKIKRRKMIWLQRCKSGTKSNSVKGPGTDSNTHGMHYLPTCFTVMRYDCEKHERLFLFSL